MLAPCACVVRVEDAFGAAVAEARPTVACAPAVCAPGLPCAHTKRTLQKTAQLCRLLEWGL